MVLERVKPPSPREKHHSVLKAMQYEVIDFGAAKK